MNTNPTPPTRTLHMLAVMFRRELALAAALSVAANLLMLTPTLYMLQLFDRVLVSQSVATLVAVSLVCLFLVGLMAAAEWARSRLLVDAATRLDEQLGTRLFHASFRASLSDRPTGAARALQDLLQVRQFLTGAGLPLLFDAPWAPIYIAVIFLLHPWLGLLAIGFVAVQLGLAILGHRRTVAPAQASALAAGEAVVDLQGKLAQAEVIESMGLAEPLLRRWQARHARVLALARQAHGAKNRVSASSRFIRYAQQSLTLAAGALLVIDGELTAGAMIASNLLMVRALSPIDQLVSSWQGFATTNAALQRIDALLQAYPEREVVHRGIAPTGRLALRGVEATADGRSDPIVQGIDLEVPAGTVVVVQGPSGSGKSTLARVILGLWPQAGGEVLLDDLPLSDWNRAELGPYLGYLPQDVELLAGTIAENIARGGPIDPARVVEAAHCAGLNGLILRLPQGYETPVGDAGAFLSGGMRQRIALARAVYGHPALVVLDEPNASLDEAGEAALVVAVRKLKARGSTVVLITHRPGIVATADWLLRLEGGRIAASGPRDAVIATSHSRRKPPAPARPDLAQPA